MCRQTLIDPLAALIAHQTRHRHRHPLNHPAVTHQDDAAFLFDEGLNGAGHLLVATPTAMMLCESVPRIGYGAALNSIAAQRQGDITGVFVPLHDCYLHISAEGRGGSCRFRRG